MFHSWNTSELAAADYADPSHEENLAGLACFHKYAGGAMARSFTVTQLNANLWPSRRNEVKRAIATLAIAALAAIAWAQPKVAVLDAAIPKDMDTSVIVPVTDKITEALVSSERYTVLDRDNIDSVLKEREFQLSDMVSDQDAAIAGKYLGADFVVIIKVQKIGDTYYVSGKMIDVKSGVIATESSAQREGKLSTLIGLAQEVGDNLSGTSEIGNTARQKANGEVKNAKAVIPQPTASPKSAVLPVLLNIIPGLGIGSFVEGDTLGGLVCLGGTALGWTLVVSGSLTYTVAVANALTTFSTPPTNGLGTVMLGIVVGTGTFVYGIVRPITYANKYNQDHSFAALDIQPTLTTTSSNGATYIAPGAVVKLSY